MAKRVLLPPFLSTPSLPSVLLKIAVVYVLQMPIETSVERRVSGFCEGLGRVRAITLRPRAMPTFIASSGHVGGFVLLVSEGISKHGIFARWYPWAAPLVVHADVIHGRWDLGRVVSYVKGGVATSVHA